MIPQVFGGFSFFAALLALCAPCAQIRAHHTRAPPSGENVLGSAQTPAREFSPCTPAYLLFFSPLLRLLFARLARKLGLPPNLGRGILPLHPRLFAFLSSAALPALCAPCAQRARITRGLRPLGRTFWGSAPNPGKGILPCTPLVCSSFLRPHLHELYPFTENIDKIITFIYYKIFNNKKTGVQKPACHSRHAGGRGRIKKLRVDFRRPAALFSPPK